MTNPRFRGVSHPHPAFAVARAQLFAERDCQAHIILTWGAARVVHLGTSRFVLHFRPIYEVTPSEWRHMVKGEGIRTDPVPIR